MLATEYSEYFEISPQGQHESDDAFQHRVALALRASGRLIEAHEAESDSRYDDESGDAMTGIIGAIAQAAQGINYRGDAIDNDFVAGVVARHPKDNTSAILGAMMMMLGK